MEKENNKNRLTAKITAFIAASEIGQLKPGVVGQEYKCSAYFTIYYDLSSSEKYLDSVRYVALWVRIG